MQIKKFLSRFRNDLGIQLLILYSLFVVPLVIIAIAFDQFASERLRQEIVAGDLALAQAIAEETNTTIENALLSIAELSQYQAVIEADEEGMLEIFEHVMSVRPDVNLIYRLTPDGIMMFNYPETPTKTIGTNFSFRSYFKRALTSESSLISVGRISPANREPVATAVMPIWQQGEFLGVVATNIKLQSFSTTLESIAMSYPESDQFDIVIVDSIGNTVATPEIENLLVNLKPLLPDIIAEVLAGGEGSRIDQSADQPERLYSYVPVPSAGWGVIVSKPTSVAFRTPELLHRGVNLVIAVFSGIGIFFWGALYLNVLKPLEKLAAYSTRAGSEHKTEDDIELSISNIDQRKDQIGNLIRSFSRMEKSLQARIDQLGTLLETSQVVVSSLDPEIVLTTILEQVERLLGIKKSTIVALEESSGTFKSQASRGLSPSYAEELVFQPDERSSITVRALQIGQPIIIQDVEVDLEFEYLRERAKKEGYRGFAAIPLQTIHAPPAALVLYSPEADVFTDNNIDLLLSFANQAAMAIEHAALFSRSDSQLQKQTSRLEALIQSLEVGLVLENLNGDILYVNRMVLDLVNLPESEILGKPVDLLFSSIFEDAENKDEAHQEFEAMFSGESEQEITFMLDSSTAQKFYRLRGFTVQDNTGLLIGYGQFLQDMTKEHELDRMKTGLISTVSHELQTPLASIKGFATTLLAKDVEWEPESQREFLEIISSEADRLSNLVNNLLDISRIEAGSLTLKKIYCSFQEIVEAAIQHAAPAQGIRIDTEIPGDLPQVLIDPYRVEVIIRNLIENAVKYSKNVSPITVTVNLKEGFLVTRVIDQGPGIAEEYRMAVFESFYRLESGLDRTTPGVGLGLAICRGFVQAHGGEIWVEEQAVGACLAFSLPLD
jgi:signal transduction histidine kinase